jgi:PadR family transcriptional regulator, regulatory protein PadR
MKQSASLGDFEQVLLLAILRLKLHGAYGVSIRHEITACTKREPTPGAIYTTLDRLETKGLVRSFVGESSPERGGRAKRFYELTTLGMHSLQRVQCDYRNLLKGLKLLEGMHV